MDDAADEARPTAGSERKEAVVVFDDASTTVEKLVETTKNAGFPNAHLNDPHRRTP